MARLAGVDLPREKRMEIALTYIFGIGPASAVVVTLIYALPPLARAVELRDNAPVFRNNLGIALERTGHPVAARDQYRAALEVDSTYRKAAVSLEPATTRDDEETSPLTGLVNVTVGGTWSETRSSESCSSIVKGASPCAMSSASRISASGTSLAPHSTIRTASSVPATTRSRTGATIWT